MLLENILKSVQALQENSEQQTTTPTPSPPFFLHYIVSNKAHDATLIANGGLCHTSPSPCALSTGY